MPALTSPPSPRIRRGFTLIELLVTIGIILIVVSIAIPAVNAAKKHAYRVRASQDIAALSAALQAYKDITGYFPSIKTDGTYTTDGDLGNAGNHVPGGELYASLFTSFIGADGAHYGPIMAAGSFEVDTTTNGTSLSNAAIRDHNGRNFIYMPAYPGMDITKIYPTVFDPVILQSFSGTGQYAEYVGTPLWRLPHCQHPGIPYYPLNANDSGVTCLDVASLAEWRYILGDRYNYPSQDGTCNPAHGDAPAITGPFILWFSGPSKNNAAYGASGYRFGLIRDRTGNLLGTPPSAANRWHGYTTDDIMNFSFAP